jgi:four helix bundle protein
MSKNFITISDIPVYLKSEELGNKVWSIVMNWGIFEKKTIGEQLVRSIDSISANLAEGFGRYFRKDKVKFYYYARASAIESIIWIQKSYDRRLIEKECYEEIKRILLKIPQEINILINITYNKLKL